MQKFPLLSLFIPLLAYAYNDWAITDLLFVRDTIVANHPGMHNNEDPAFFAYVEQFFHEAQQELAAAHSDDECKSILRRFGKRFDDAHLSIYFPEQSVTQVTNLMPQPDESFSCSVIIPNTLWVRIPLFMLRDEDKSVMESIIAAMPLSRTFPHIVFDLRGNRGGSSAWGEQIADALFGKSYSDARRAYARANQFVEWRASIDNINYWRTEAMQYVTTAFGADSEAMQWVLKVIDGMQQAYDAGEIYYCEESKYKNILMQGGESLCVGTIIVVVDRYCGSACLDFIDELKLLGTHVILVGQQTGADSLYMDVRNIPLPSDRGCLRMPVKVYRNRPRGHNVPYVPDIAYAGDMKDTKAIQEWVLQIK